VIFLIVAISLSYGNLGQFTPNVAMNDAFPSGFLEYQLINESQAGTQFMGRTGDMSPQSLDRDDIIYLFPQYFVIRKNVL